MNTIETLAMNSLRVLSIDAVQKANSGHPGMPLGAAPMAYAVWANHMKFNPANPKWVNRDRFVLSAGHGSALLYSLLHVFGYDVTKEDLMNFRQFDSRTPGHPEYGHTDGVEATTGPLGAGLSTAVGMAMAQEHLAAKYNRAGFPVFDNFTFVISGDGCMMEGITSEASSLAGTLNLGRLIVLYDSNNITIEGSTDLAFHEDVSARYEAYGFDTYLVEDGNDIEAISAAIAEAKQNLDRPSFIEVRTHIGFGTPKQDSASSHGAPIGAEGIEAFKSLVNYPSMEPFYVPEEVYAHYKAIAEEGAQMEREYHEMMARYREAYPDLYAALENDFKDIDLDELLSDASLFEFEDKPMATRNVSGLMINRLKDKYTNLFGGSADLAPSNMTNMNDEDSFSSQNYLGRNIHFGIREHAMAAMGNGIVLYGGSKAYVATFFVFADFLKPMARLSALMGLPLTYVLTHDSIGVGEDGPTHEPVEQLTMLRAMPNFISFRPADARETAYGWALALTSKTTPVALMLSRQNLPQLENSGRDALKGGYVIKDVATPQAILIATGSEVSLAIDAATELERENISVRVVSMPSLELFRQQPISYQNEVLPVDMRKRIVIEAGSRMSWGEIVGLDGDYVTLDHFGGSAPGPVLFKEFGFTVDNVVEKVKNVIK